MQNMSPTQNMPYLVFSLLLLALAASAYGAEEADVETPGAKAFLAAKCNICHGVEAVEIAPKAKSAKMHGPDLGGYKIEVEFAAFVAYNRKAGELNGKTHKKEFKGTDEELQAIMDWLATLEAKGE